MILARAGCVADENDFTEMTEVLLRNRLKLGKQAFADDGYGGLAVIEDVLVFMGFGLSIHGNGYGANLDGAEKGVEKFGRVEKQQEHALFRADAEAPEGIGGAVGALEELLIRDALVAAFDSDVLGSALKDVAVHEIRGNVEKLRQRDHLAALFVAR